MQLCRIKSVLKAPRRVSEVREIRACDETGRASKEAHLVRGFMVAEAAPAPMAEVAEAEKLEEAEEAEEAG